MRVLSSTQMRDADRRTIEEIGIPSLVLMENAGRQAVAAMEAMYSDLLERRIAVLCGRGNNGGDGCVVARTLVQRGGDVSVFLLGRVADVRGDARTNLETLGRLGVTVVEVADSQAWELHFSEVSDCSLIIDAVFGTGLNAPISGFIESVVADVNASGIPIVSIDIPSGLSDDSEGLCPDGVERLLEIARDVIAIGPGLGQTPRTREFVQQLVDRASMPLVIDADGLNAFAADPDRLTGRDGRDVIITPHPGEMARLSACRATKCRPTAPTSPATSPSP